MAENKKVPMLADLTCPCCGSSVSIVLEAECPAPSDISIECSTCPARWDGDGKMTRAGESADAV